MKRYLHSRARGRLVLELRPIRVGEEVAIRQQYRVSIGQVIGQLLQDLREHLVEGRSGNAALPTFYPMLPRR